MDSIKQEVSVTNNKQNTKYQIKSWQIALGGTIIQFVLIREIIYNFFLGKIIALEAVASFILILIHLTIGVVSILPLYFIKTRKIGAVISIIIGLISTLYFVLNYGLKEVSIFGVQGIFILFAGLYYFWKKV